MQGFGYMGSVGSAFTLQGFGFWYSRRTGSRVEALGVAGSGFEAAG